MNIFRRIIHAITHKTKKLLLWGLVIFVLYLGIEYLTLPNVSYLRDNNPKKTALMKQRQWEAWMHFKSFKITQSWVPYNRISRSLRRAVLVGEDASFFSHDGFDYDEIKEAVKTDIKKRSFARGASTITMQLAKNLYLSTSKSPFRKFKEIFITIRLEKELSKKRIFEIYLNSIEWGNGIFGCEAASQYYFGKPAASLTPREAAMLAASIPSPRRDNPRTNTRLFRWRTRLILSRM